MGEISELQDEIFLLVISVLLYIALQRKIHKRCPISKAALERFHIEHSSAKMLLTINKQLIERAPKIFTDLSWPLTPCNEHLLPARRKETRSDELLNQRKSERISGHSDMITIKM